MTKFIVFLYIICFPVYILFSRQPDYFDGEKTPGVVHFIKDSSNILEPYAVYRVDKNEYKVNAAYLFRSFREGEYITVIYEASSPSKGAVYSVWGYWIRWGEIIFSVIFLVVMFRIAVTIAGKPTPEALIEELEDRPRRRRKYDV